MKGPRETLSHKIGYKRGLQGLPFRCPWWADSTAFALAYVEGRKIYLDRQRSLQSLMILRNSDDYE
jgi:hypothetical protein